MGLARYVERGLDRADYLRLCEARLTEQEALIAAADATLLPLLGNDARKIRLVRDAVGRWRIARLPAPPAPALPVYEN